MNLSEGYNAHEALFYYKNPVDAIKIFLKKMSNIAYRILKGIFKNALII